MAEVNQDICLAVANKMLTNVKSREVRPNPWSLFPTCSLIEFFADRKAFFTLSNLEFETLMIEMNNRISRSLKCPASEISFNKIDINQPDAFSSGVGRTLTTGEIKISYVDEKDRDKLPEFRKKWLGLEYLNTIIHESRHAYQSFKTADYLNGKPVSSKMAYIAQDSFIEMAFCAIDENFDNNYKYSIREKDAVGFAYDMIKKLAVASDFEDEITNFNNNECATMLADNKENYDIVEMQLKAHKSNLMRFASRFTTDVGNNLLKYFKNVDEEKVRAALEQEFARHKDSLEEFIQDKINEYENTNNSYTDTLKQYYNAGDLYKSYFGILYIDKQKKPEPTNHENCTIDSEGRVL